ncbi:MAG: FAD:protein FMN transferase [Pirellulaceae bacterium]
MDVHRSDHGYDHHQVLVVGSSQAGAGVNDQATVARRITDELESVNQAMSTYRDDSEVSPDFNQSAGSDWFPVSLATATVDFQKAQEIARLSDGAFDITVSPAGESLEFRPRSRSPRHPAKRKSRPCGNGSATPHLDVRLDPPALKKTLPELSIDLSAHRQGYGVDRVALAARNPKAGAYLVEVGGEVRSRSRPDKQACEPGSVAPIKHRSDILGYVANKLTQHGDQWGLRTSSWIVTFSHTIDPATGRPVAHSLASVSVVADDMTADGLATAVSVLGYERGAAIVREFGGTLYAVERDGEAFRERIADGFPTAFASERRRNPLGWPHGVRRFGRVWDCHPRHGDWGDVRSQANHRLMRWSRSNKKGGAIPSACEMCGQKTKECSELQEAIKRRQAEEASESSLEIRLLRNGSPQ